VKYRTLGKTDLRVSVIGIGTWQYGGEWGKDFSEAEVREILCAGRDLGLNLIDTAEFKSTKRKLPIAMGVDIFGKTVTEDLAEIMLLDAAKIQEGDAEYANRKGFSKHHPALPLYTRADAERILRQFEPVDFGSPFEPAAGMLARFLDVVGPGERADRHVFLDRQRMEWPHQLAMPKSNQKISGENNMVRTEV